MILSFVLLIILNHMWILFVIINSSISGPISFGNYSRVLLSSPSLSTPVLSCLLSSCLVLSSPFFSLHIFIIISLISRFPKIPHNHLSISAITTYLQWYLHLFSQHVLENRDRDPYLHWHPLQALGCQL